MSPRTHPNDEPARPDRTARTASTEVEALRAELWNQWEYNHWEHCRNKWPHHGDCHWPVPAVLETDQKGAIETYMRQADGGESR